jgi:DNA polymerase III epsilon subunit-like protein
MKQIFFDFETSDLNFVGQILNFAFVEVDDSFNIKSSLKDKIKICPMQLPTPDAILSNRIDVIQHQKEAVETEFTAMRKIYNYIENLCEYEPVRLIGYNSNSFDLHYLRTSFIRNGLNPYFGGQLSYGDMLHAVNKLAVSNDEFLSKLKRKANGKPSMSLESVCKALGILSEDAKQDHESMSDVLLTIQLSKHLKAEFSLDITTYASYEISKRYTEFDAIEVYSNFDESGNKLPDEQCVYVLHEHNKSTALWINLSKFESGQGKKSIIWCNKNTASLFVKRYIKDADIRVRAEAAKLALSDITISNFWPDKDCDLEQSIYTLPINEIKTLTHAIHNKDLFLLKENKNKHANILYLRFLCNNSESEDVEKIANKYITYRYGGKMRLDKGEIDSTEKQYHPTYKELLTRIDSCYAETNDKLMISLKQFYMNSKIAKCFNLI